MPDVDGDLDGASAEVPADEPRDRAALPGYLASGGIETLVQFGADCVLLHIVAKGEQRGEAVGQVEEHGGRDDAHEAVVVRDCSGDDERNDPPHGHDSGVDELATLRD